MPPFLIVVLPLCRIRHFLSYLLFRLKVAMGRALRWTGRAVFFGVFAFALFVGYLKANCSCRQKIFANFMGMRDIKPTPWSNDIVCPHLAGVEGTVVDVGSGAGFSLVCYANNTAIKKLYLIEPNPEFTPMLEKNIKKFGLEDKTVIVTDVGEKIEKHIAANSVDHAVSIHLLCSVDADVLDDVVRQTSRMLKSGGQYHLVDHTLAEEGSILRMAQLAVAPVWEIIGNGCKFLDMPIVYREKLSPSFGFKPLTDKDLIEFEYPILGRFVPLI